MILCGTFLKSEISAETEEIMTKHHARGETASTTHSDDNDMVIHTRNLA